jgi:hypothetical protein
MTNPVVKAWEKFGTELAHQSWPTQAGLATLEYTTHVMRVDLPEYPSLNPATLSSYPLTSDDKAWGQALLVFANAIDPSHT